VEFVTENKWGSATDQVYYCALSLARSPESTVEIPGPGFRRTALDHTERAHGVFRSRISRPMVFCKECDFASTVSWLPHGELPLMLGYWFVTVNPGQVLSFNCGMIGHQSKGEANLRQRRVGI